MAGWYAVFHVGVGLERGIEFGADEGQEEVEEVDAEGVGDCRGRGGQIGERGVCGCVWLFLPMYQPCAKTMRRVNMRNSTPKPIHL